VTWLDPLPPRVISIPRSKARPTSEGAAILGSITDEGAIEDTGTGAEEEVEEVEEEGEEEAVARS